MSALFNKQAHPRVDLCRRACEDFADPIQRPIVNQINEFVQVLIHEPHLAQPIILKDAQGDETELVLRKTLERWRVDMPNQLHELTFSQPPISTPLPGTHHDVQLPAGDPCLGGK